MRGSVKKIKEKSGVDTAGGCPPRPISSLAKRAHGVKRSGQYASKLEARFAAHLDMRRAAGEVLWWQYEGITLRLGYRTSYTPDFIVQETSGEIVLYECKGFMRDDAAVKLKVAASLFPFRIVLVRQSKTGFLCEEVGHERERDA